MVKIYTKSGDNGKTNLLFGGNTSKSDLRVETYGTVDEAVSFLGLAKSLITNNDIRKIIELLKQDENIENKFIMSFEKIYSYHTNSKLIHTTFTEGSADDTIEDFIRKTSWSYYELYLSANNSLPPHKNLDIVQIPDYLIYTFSKLPDDPNTTWYDDNVDNSNIKILQNPKDPAIPKFLNPIYYSAFGNGGVVVYEVNLQD